MKKGVERKLRLLNEKFVETGALLKIENGIKDFHWLCHYPCGHSKEVIASSLNKRLPLCVDCNLVRHETEAKAAGVEIQGKSELGPNYRVYKLQCGHSFDLQVTHVRRNNFKCTICLEKDISSRLPEACTNEGMSPDHDVTFRIVKFTSCGHSYAHRFGAWHKDMFCQVCKRDELEKRLDSFNYKYIKRENDSRILIQYKDCGHFRSVHESAVWQGRSECRVCVEAHIRQQAEDKNIELLGEAPSKRWGYRLYKLPCGCIREIRMGHLRIGNWSCTHHAQNHYMRPSKIYLLELQHEDFKWLKMGFAENIKERVQNYNLREGTTWTVLKEMDFDIGYEAMVVEKDLHRFNKHLRENKQKMSSYHLRSGRTECYQITAKEHLIAEIEEYGKKETD